MAVRVTEKQLQQLLGPRQQEPEKTAKPFRLRAPAGPKESEIQADIVTFMRARGAIGGKQIVGIVHPYRRPQLLMSGMPDGTADTLWIDPEYGVVFIEAKTEKGRLSDLQVAFRDAVEFCGGTWLVVRSTRDLAHQLDRLGRRDYDLREWWEIRARHARFVEEKNKGKRVFK